MKKSIIQVEGLTAAVKLNNGDFLTTVNNVSFQLSSGESYAIVGKSGSGKTSLISILGLLNSAFQGKYYYEGLPVSKMSDKELSRLRSREFGFVFQNYSLIEHLKVWENIELPLLYAKTTLNKKQRQNKIIKLLQMVGLENRIMDFPSVLSGGEQQRVAIARALVVSPHILICDEPTGALDKKTGESVIKLLLDLVKRENITLLLVTHDPDLAKTCNTIFTMDEGRITNVSYSD